MEAFSVIRCTANVRRCTIHHYSKYERDVQFPKKKCYVALEWFLNHKFKLVQIILERSVE